MSSVDESNTLPEGESSSTTNMEITSSKEVSSKVYDPESLLADEGIADLGIDMLGLHGIHGYDWQRKQSFFLLDPTRLLYVTSASLVIVNLDHEKTNSSSSSHVEYYPPFGMPQGIGAVALHPSRRWLAVGGRGYQPNILIYSLPSMTVTHVLRGGAEYGYASLSFTNAKKKKIELSEVLTESDTKDTTSEETSTDQKLVEDETEDELEVDLLASVSESPDYMLTVWNWREEAMTLHAKAFGQDVWRVEWSPFDPYRLVTSGVGHLRFWKIATTFTGKKLQGALGRFGRVDLSDVEAFCELPDGKVVSGTESGSLLLWEGGFVKCRFVMVGGNSCHGPANPSIEGNTNTIVGTGIASTGGNVTAVLFDRKEGVVITTGLDGWIRWWDYGAIDNAEVDSDHTMDFELLPLAEIQLTKEIRSGSRSTSTSRLTSNAMSAALKTNDEPEIHLGVRSLLDSGDLEADRRQLVILDTTGTLRRLVYSLVPVSVADVDGDMMTPRHLVTVIHSFAEQQLSTKVKAEPEPTTGTAPQTARSDVASSQVTARESAADASEDVPEVVPENPQPAEEFLVQRSTINQFHAGPILSMAVCPCDHLIATGGDDGMLRVLDYHSGTELAHRHFSMAVTSLLWLPMELDESGTSFLAGFADGTIRIFTVRPSRGLIRSEASGKSTASNGSDRWQLVRRLVLKPHNTAVKDMALSTIPSEYSGLHKSVRMLLATTGSDGIVFFIGCSPIDMSKSAEEDRPIFWRPLHLVSLTTLLPGRQSRLVATALSFSSGGNQIIATCTDCILRQISIRPIYESWEQQVQKSFGTLGSAEVNTVNPTSGDENAVSLQGEDDPTTSANYSYDMKLPVITIQPTVVCEANTVNGIYHLHRPVESTQDEVNNEEVDETENTPAATSTVVRPSTADTAEVVEPPVTVPLRANLAVFMPAEEGKPAQLVGSGSLTSNQHVCFLADLPDEFDPAGCLPSSEILNSGLYTADGRDARRTPVITALGVCGDWVCAGFQDGSVAIRRKGALQVYARSSAHSSHNGGVRSVAMSFDGTFVISIGGDGVLTIFRRRCDIWDTREKAVVLQVEDALYQQATETAAAAAAATNPSASTLSVNFTGNNPGGSIIDGLIREKPISELKSYIFHVVPSESLKDQSLLAIFRDPSSSSPANILMKTLKAAVDAATSLAGANDGAAIISAITKIELPERPDLPPGTYSIQENRLRQEADVRQTAAAALKARVIASVRSLRTDFERLLKENDALPPTVRLPVGAGAGSGNGAASGGGLTLDSSFFQTVLQRRLESLSEVHRECVYDGEKAEILLEKISQRLMKGLLVEEMPLSALPDVRYDSTTGRPYIMGGGVVNIISEESVDSSANAELDTESSTSSLPLRTTRKVVKIDAPLLTVRSLRTQAMDSTVVKRIHQVRSETRAAELEKKAAKSAAESQKRADAAMLEMKNRLQQYQGITVDDSSGGILAGTNTAAAGATGAGRTIKGGTGETALLRRQARLERKQQLLAHEAERPSGDADDPRDLAAISRAESTIGDYKLKSAGGTGGGHGAPSSGGSVAGVSSSTSTEVENERVVNVDSKLKEMATLEESMFVLRVKFNERFLALRDIKRQLVHAIRRDNCRIHEIDEELGATEKSLLWEPVIDPDEFPEDYDEVTKDELDAYKLQRYGTVDAPVPNEDGVLVSAGKEVAWATVVPRPQSVVVGKKLLVRNDGHIPDIQRVRKPIPQVNDLLKNAQANANLSGNNTDIKNNGMMRFLADQNLANYTPPRTDALRPYETNSSLLISQPSQLVSNLIASEVTMEDINSASVIEEAVPILRFTKSLHHRRMINAAASAVATQALIAQRKYNLTHERYAILEHMTSNILAFREAVSELRVDRAAVLSDLKAAELKLLVLYREFRLLETFESRGVALETRQSRYRAELTEAMTALSASDTDLRRVTGLVEASQSSIEKIKSEFSLLVSSSHTYHDLLQRIFLRRIKRSKHGNGVGAGGDGGDSDGSGSDDESDTGDGESDEEDYEEDYDMEDTCPPGCEQSLFETVLALRERRLDEEEMLVSHRKAQDEFKRQSSRSASRATTLEKEVQAVGAEIRLFQQQKQAALNQIDVVVPLRLSQIYSFEDSGVLTGPDDSSAGNNNTTVTPSGIASTENALSDDTNRLLDNPDRREIVPSIGLTTHALFHTTALNKLRERITSLGQEIQVAKEGFKALHRQRTNLIRDREGLEESTNRWTSRCHELQMLKFGREIDLDDLEQHSDRTREFSLEATLEEDRKKFEAESAQLASAVEKAQEELMKKTRTHTDLLRRVAELTECQLKMTRELNAPTATSAPTNTMEDLKSVEERRRIKAFTQFQATELTSLRTELNMLRRKEAPIFSYGTTATPIPPQNGMQALMSQTSGSVLSNASNRRDGDLVLPPIPTGRKMSR